MCIPNTDSRNSKREPEYFSGVLFCVNEREWTRDQWILWGVIFEDQKYSGVPLLQTAKDKILYGAKNTQCTQNAQHTQHTQTHLIHTVLSLYTTIATITATTSFTFSSTLLLSLLLLLLPPLLLLSF